MSTLPKNGDYLSCLTMGMMNDIFEESMASGPAARLCGCVEGGG